MQQIAAAMSYTDAEWAEIESYSHFNFAAPTTPLSEHTVATELGMALGALGTTPPVRPAPLAAATLSSWTTVVPADRNEQHLQTKGGSLTNACVCKHCGQGVFIILQTPGGRCTDCNQRARFVTQCAACRRPNCFVCWAALSAHLAPQTSFSQSTELDVNRARCRACLIECKTTSLPGHWRSATHFRKMIRCSYVERFCSNQCSYGGPQPRVWVSLREHIATAHRIIPEPLRVANCCTMCGGLTLA